MSDFAATAALILSVLCILFAAAALITKALHEGSLQADIRWVRRVAKTYIRHIFHTN